VRNAQLPFRYPADQYSRRVQGNVTLRLYVDSSGRVLAESTRVEATSGYTALDSAAVKGSHELEFEPARRRGRAVPVAVLFPVYFRHPEAAPLTDDTILQKAQPR
jgi:periplasmic protein TonB